MLEMVLVVGGVLLFIYVVVGNVLMFWWIGCVSKMSLVVVFVVVLVFGWLWGVWGLLLGVFILLVVKLVCDYVDDFKLLGELFGF